MSARMETQLFMKTEEERNCWNRSKHNYVKRNESVGRGIRHACTCFRVLLLLGRVGRERPELILQLLPQTFLGLHLGSSGINNGTGEDGDDAEMFKKLRVIKRKFKVNKGGGTVCPTCYHATEDELYLILNA